PAGIRGGVLAGQEALEGVDLRAPDGGSFGGGRRAGPGGTHGLPDHQRDSEGQYGQAVATQGAPALRDPLRPPHLLLSFRRRESRRSKRGQDVPRAPMVCGAPTYAISRRSVEWLGPSHYADW